MYGSCGCVGPSVFEAQRLESERNLISAASTGSSTSISDCALQSLRPVFLYFSNFRRCGFQPPEFPSHLRILYHLLYFTRKGTLDLCSRLLLEHKVKTECLMTVIQLRQTIVFLTYDRDTFPLLSCLNYLFALTDKLVHLHPH